MTPALHRFELDGKRYALDPESCFCFECDEVSWDVIEHYPNEPLNRILHLLGEKHPPKELQEVVGELEWLRASKSILTPPKHDEIQKFFELERGLRRLSVVLPGETTPSNRPRWLGSRKTAEAPATPGMALAQRAENFLLAHAEMQKELYLELVADDAALDAAGLAAFVEETLKSAALAGKKLTVAICLKRLPALEGHAASVKIEFQSGAVVPGPLTDFVRARNSGLAKLAKVLHAGETGVSGRIVLVPAHPEFTEAVRACESTGYRVIEIDADGAFVARPKLDPRAMLEGMRKTAVYYAERLLQQHYFRLEPIAGLFWRIYNGTPLRRADPAGVNELAVARDGGIYPSRHFLGDESFRCGSLTDGTVDESLLRRFEDVGGTTTPECLRCWARNLCGGGTAAVHQALSGSFRRPHEPWCDAQRLWIESAVAAFNLLTSQGVNFTRVYGGLGQESRPSLFTLIRAAFRINIGIRPIEESDAEWLTRWENWNEAAYFLCTESGLFLATKYDREMDALHPRGYEQELVLLRKTGEPMGLLKIRPEREPGCATAWVYLHDAADYGSEGVRRSFRALLSEAAKQQGLRRIMAPVGPKEEALAGFLTAIGFAPAGILREGVYVHGVYHDVRVFVAALDAP